jgi:hypothetical protein
MRVTIPPRHSHSDKYSPIFTGMRSGRLIDRNKAIDFYDGAYKFPNLTPIPKITTSLSIEECIEDSVFRLSVEDKNIYLLWSGGIDSTVALLGCWKYNRSLFTDDKITVLHSPSSIKESPFMYEWIKKNNIKTIETDSVMNYIKDDLKNQCASNLYVTGEIGDQIMGNFANLASFPLLNDEENFLSKDIFSFLKPIENEKQRNAWSEFYHTIYDNRLTEIETVFDLLSWATFSCKYEHPKYRIWLSIERRINTYSFYDTDEFQNWSLNNNWRQKCNGNWWTKYKMPLKKFIHDVTGSEYALTMYKQGSLIKDHSIKGRTLFYIDKYLNLRPADGHGNILT